MPPENLLIALEELLTRIPQWHPNVDPEYGEILGESLAVLLSAALTNLGTTTADVEAWVGCPLRTLL